MKSRLPIIAAIVLAVLAILVFRSYINNVKQEYAAKAKGAYRVAARRDIPAGTEIERGMLTSNEVPKAQVRQDHFKVREVGSLVGRVARVTIKKDRPLVISDLQIEKGRGFESLIPPGERAYTLKLATGIRPDLVEASDRVDILVTFAKVVKRKAGAAGSAAWSGPPEMVTIVLLQNVVVLHRGSSYAPAARRKDSGKDVTVAVTLPEAQLLMFADEHGDLAAVLRKHDDISTMKREDLPRVTAHTLEELIGDLDTERKGRSIQILKAGKVEEVTVSRP